jgi:hypothetical protein
LQESSQNSEFYGIGTFKLRNVKIDLTGLLLSPEGLHPKNMQQLVQTKKWDKLMECFTKKMFPVYVANIWVAH